jgi:hypothetical protein
MTLREIASKLPAVGYGLGALAWGTSTELNYALVPRVCGSHWPLIPLLAVVLALIAASGFALSVMAWRQDRPLPSPDRPEAGAPHKLLAGIGVLSGALFTTVIVMQGVAALFLSGCE